MPSSTSALLQIVDMANGENENTWGDTNDANLTKLENAIANAGAHTSTGGTTTLTSDQARNAMLIFSGVLASDHTVVVPARTKLWLVRNNHTLGGNALKFKTSSGTAVTIPQSFAAVNVVFCDGTDIYVAGTTEAIVDAKIQAAAKVYTATVGGTANAITLDTSPAGYARTAGNIITFVPGSDNTGAVTINPETIGAVALLKQTPEGTAACSGGELQAGHRVLILDDGVTFQLIGDPTRLLGSSTDIASAATTDIGTVLSHVARITGTTSITAFGSSASLTAPIYFLRFADALTLTHNGTSLIIPGGSNITTADGDTAVVEYLGSGNWRVRDYQRANGKAIVETDQIPAGTSGHLFASDGSGGGAFNGNSTVRARASVTDGTSATCTVNAGKVNVASVTLSTNTYTVTFTSALASNDYEVVITLTGTGGFTDVQHRNVVKSTTGFTFDVIRSSTGANSTYSAFDIAVFGGW